ncbi:MAG: efflux transporter outer membrane subunit, partial [Limisphaerales bacterium]
DTDTKTLILDAAEQAFADLGFDAASLRHIISVAGVNLAAVHYHFGSKEALIQAVFARRIGPLNDERLQLLDEFLTHTGDRRPRLEPIIESMIRPALKLARDPDQGGPDVMRLFGRTIAEPSDELQAMVNSQFGDVAKRFGEALARACPELPAHVLMWRFHFMIGTMGHVMADPTKISSFTGGMCDPSDTQEVVRQMTAFLAGGFRAPVVASKKKRSVAAAKLVALGLLVVFATACSSTKTPEESVNAPALWSTSTARARPANEWWHEFGDSNLVQLVETALIQNYDLKAMKARVEAAQEQSRIAGAVRLPTVDAQFGSSRQQQVFVGLPIPGAAGPLKTRYNTHQFNLVANWELDIWGRISSGNKAALADYLAATDDLQGARLSLVGQIVRSWFRLTEAERQLELAQRTAGNFETTRAKVQERYEQGIRPPLELRLANSKASSARALVALREAEANDARRQLQALAGKYPNGKVTGGSLPYLTAEVPAGLPSELLGRRPDLLAARWRLEAAGYRVAEAKASLLPRLSLTANGGRTSNELEDLLEHNFSIWSIAANAAQPIFQGGRLRANVRLNKALTKAEAAEYDSAVLNAFREVETALANEAILQRREMELSASSSEAKAAESLAQQRYEAGLEPYTTLLETQRRALEAESQLITVRRVRLDNRIALHLALGGGFEMKETDEDGS